MNKDTSIILTEDIYKNIKELADMENISIEQMINIILEKDF